MRQVNAFVVQYDIMTDMAHNFSRLFGKKMHLWRSLNNRISGNAINSLWTCMTEELDRTE